MPDSRRERLLQEMERVFQSSTGTGGTTFSEVFDAPITGRAHKGRTILAIIEGDEPYIDVVSPNKRDRRLGVELQVLSYVPTGEKPRAYLNNILADMEEIVEANRLWGGLAMATIFRSNITDRSNTADRTVEAVLFIDVQYRTARDDPRA